MSKNINSVLLRRQLESIGLLLQEMDFSPSDFEWKVEWRNGRDCGILCFPKIPSYYFELAFPNHSGILMSFSPGNDTAINDYLIGDIENELFWKRQLGLLRIWLKNISTDMKAYDFWGSTQNQKQVAKEILTDSDKNRDFESAEKALIYSYFRKIEESIGKSTEANSEQLKIINEQLRYLEGAAERTGRIDWKNLVVGVVLSLFTQALIPSDVSNQLVGLFTSLFQQLFSSNQLPPSDSV